jgi:hypothetical protein
MSDRTEIEIPETGLVPEPESVDPPQNDQPREKTPRELAMEKILAKVETNRQAEIDQGRVYDEDARAAGLTFEQDEPEPATEPDAPPAPQPKPAQPAHTAAPVAPELVTVQLDGQSVQVTQDQLVQLARMGMIANSTIQEYQRASYQPQPPPPPAPPAPPRSVIDDAKIRDTVKRIQYGTEDDASGALSELIGQVVQNAAQPPQHIDPVAIANYAATVAQQRAQMAADTAVIHNEYKDIISNPQLSQLAALNVQAIRQEHAMLGVRKSDLDIFREAGNRVLDALGKPRPDAASEPPAAPAGNPPASQASGLVVRPRTSTDARKREAPRATSQVVGLRQPAPEAPRAPTGSDIVEQYRKARGQSSMR